MLQRTRPHIFASGKWRSLHSSAEQVLRKDDKQQPQQVRQRKPLEFPKIVYEWPFPDFRERQTLWKINSAVSVFFVGWWGKWVLTRLNKVKIKNLNILNDAIFRRPKGIPLITVANHESCLDDPCLIGALMTNRELMSQKNMRWGIAAHDVCFLKPWHSWIFSHGKCAPIVRGMGVHQKGMDFAIERLREGHWFHIFPEGGVNMERKSLRRLKWGIGRIISEINVNPIVIPFWHVGMHNVLPNWKPYYPRRRKKVFINIGQPIDLSKVLDAVKDCNAIEKRKAITDVIQEKMAELRIETLELAKAEGITTISDEPEQIDDGGK